MKKFLLLPALLLCSAILIYSVDFGLLVDQKAEAGDDLGSGDVSFSYSPGFTPWFSWDGGQNLSLYFSGFFSMDYNHYDDNIDDNDGWKKPVLLPELSRFSVSYRPNRDLLVQAGRIPYTDALGFAASGLFDGFLTEAAFPNGSVTAGCFYTGFLYKETAKITMTGGDMQNYAEPWDWDYFGDYFASRRALAAFRWDMPLLEFHNLTFEALAQFDLNGNDESLHSQYGEVLADLFLSSKLGITAGALFEIMEIGGEGGYDLTSALGGLVRMRTEIPGALDDGMTFAVKFTSGSWNDTFTTFTPVTSSAQGFVFPGTLAGLCLISTDYTLRLLPALFLESSLRYFLRTYDNTQAEGKYAYGGEFWASLAWQPFDDLRFSLGSGVFFPSLGNVYPSGTGPLWKAQAGISLSL
jgi:hypothetical protein